MTTTITFDLPEGVRFTRKDREAISEFLDRVVELRARKMAARQKKATHKFGNLVVPPHTRVSFG